MRDQLPPIEDRPDDTEGDGEDCPQVDLDLLELHEVLEFEEAAKWAEGNQ